MLIDLDGGRVSLRYLIIGEGLSGRYRLVFELASDTSVTMETLLCFTYTSSADRAKAKTKQDELKAQKAEHSSKLAECKARKQEIGRSLKEMNDRRKAHERKIEESERVLHKEEQHLESMRRENRQDEWERVIACERDVRKNRREVTPSADLHNQCEAFRKLTELRQGNSTGSEAAMSPDFLGLAQELGQYERADVNEVVSAMIGGSIQLFFFKTQASLDALKRQIGGDVRPYTCVNLTMSMCFNFFWRGKMLPVREDGQQLLDMPDTSGVQGCLGYAVNMIRIPERYLREKVELPNDPQYGWHDARKGKTVGCGLRETALYFVMRDLLVFKTQADMMRYAELAPSKKLGRSGALVSLDKQKVQQDGRQSGGRMASPAGLFPYVDFATKLRGALDPRVKPAKEANDAKEKYEHRTRQMKDSIARNQESLETSKSALDDPDAQHEWERLNQEKSTIDDEIKQLQQTISQLDKEASTIMRRPTSDQQPDSKRARTE